MQDLCNKALQDVIAAKLDSNKIHSSQTGLRQTHDQTKNLASNKMETAASIQNNTENNDLHEHWNNDSRSINNSSLSSISACHKLSCTQSALTNYLNEMRLNSGLAVNTYASCVSNCKSVNLTSDTLKTSNDTLKSSVDFFILANTKQMSTLNNEENTDSSFENQQNTYDSKGNCPVHMARKPHWNSTNLSDSLTNNKEHLKCNEANVTFIKSDAISKHTNELSPIINDFQGNEIGTQFVTHEKNSEDNKDLNNTYSSSDSFLSDLLRMEKLAGESLPLSQTLSSTELQKPYCYQGRESHTVVFSINENDDTKDLHSEHFSESYKTPSSKEASKNLSLIFTSSQDSVVKQSQPTQLDSVDSLAQYNPLDAFIYLRTGKRKLETDSTDENASRKEKNSSYPATNSFSLLKVGAISNPVSKAENETLTCKLLQL